MHKITYTPTRLDCRLQSNTEILPGKCHLGLLSLKSKGFCFEEVVRHGRKPRNPKLFDGKYVSLVRMQNGRYQMHLKTMAPDTDISNYAFAVYTEINQAMKWVVGDQ